MLEEYDWNELNPAHRSRLIDWSNNALRSAMLFGVLAIAMALFATPLLDRGTRTFAGGLGVDPITTASTPQSRTYTIRRSVLQRSPSSVCVIHANGARSGDC